MASGPDDKGELVFYFESNYYAMPKELYVEGSKLSALDRGLAEVVIDLDKGAIVKSPDDRIRLDRVDRGDVITLSYSMHGLDSDDNHQYTIDGEFRDASGKAYDTKYSSTSRYTDTNEQRSMTQIPNEAYKGPITFKLYSYPSFIQEPFRIKIK